MVRKFSPDSVDNDDPAGLLAAIGDRVRALRLRRGMTRKALAAESGVSERHLAQLEPGRGNMSIALLARIARALGADLADLVRQGADDSAETILVGDMVRQLSADDQREVLDWMHARFLDEADAEGRIALIGLRGAGKTTLGRELAQRLGVPFVGLVAEVEKLAGMKTSEVFELSGQRGYRRLEARALAEAVTQHAACVLEAGGSIVAEPSQFNTLLSRCRVVWIRARPEEHMQRVVDQGDLRPMAGHDDALSDLKRILSEREPFYRRAHLVLDSSGRTVAECVDELVGKVAGAANPDAAASTGESVRGDMAEHVAQRSPGRVS